MEIVVMDGAGTPMMRTNALCCINAAQIKEQRRAGCKFLVVEATPAEAEELMRMGLRKGEIRCSM